MSQSHLLERLKPSEGMFVRVLAITSCLVVLLGPGATAQENLQQKTPPVEISPTLSTELAFGHGVLPRQERPVLTKDGARLAYVVRTPPVESPPGYRILQNGVPAGVVGSKLFVTEVATATSHAIAPDAGNCWRPSWSADGARLAFYCDGGGVPQLWVYDVNARRSQRLADARVKAKLWGGDEPLWSHDGRLIYVPLAAEIDPATPEDPAAKRKGLQVTLYRFSPSTPKEVSDEEENASWVAHFMRENNAAVAAVDTTSGAVRILVRPDAAPPPSVLRVSASGRWISYLSVFRNLRALDSAMYHDLAVVGAEGGPIHVLASNIRVQEGNYYRGTYLWHPTRDQLFWVKDERLWTSVFGAGAPTAQPLAPALTDVTPTPLGLTRDGVAVVVSTESGLLALVPIAGGDPRTIKLPPEMTLQRLVTSDGVTAWQPDGNMLTVIAREAASAMDVVLRVDLDLGRVSELWRGLARMGVVGSPTDHSWLAVIHEDMNTSGNIYQVNAGFRDRRQLTDVDVRLSGVKFGPVETFETNVSLPDGSLSTVTTGVLLPRGGKRGDRLPAVVFIYPGSKVSRMAAEYAGGFPSTVPVSVFTARGYAVLLSELPLGPTSQPGQPVKEMTDLLLPQVFHAAELGYIDLARVAVSGHSYGGYGTAAILTGTNLFRAGVAISGLYDVPGRYGSIDERGMANVARWAETGQGRMGTHPWADLQRYVKNSPYYQADQIHSPLLMLHGGADTICPVEEPQKMFTALKRLRRTVELAVYSGEGHSVRDWSLANAVDATERMLAFLDRHVMGTESSTGSK